MQNSDQQAIRPVLVVGGGVAGIQAALDLAKLGFPVELVEKNRFLGGQVLLLDKVYPTDHCAFCPMWLQINEVWQHPNITVHLGKELIELDEFAGEITATLQKVAELSSDNPSGRKVPGQQMPKSILPGTMLNIFEADVSALGSVEQILVQDVIWATGFYEPVSAPAPEFGSGQHPDIITAMNFEHLTHEGAKSNYQESGELKKLCKPSDGQPVTGVAFIQCAGARDLRYLSYCAAVCCMHALKEATWLKRRQPELDVAIFYTDLRTPGKGQEAYARAAEALGIRLIKIRPGMIIPAPNGIMVRYARPQQPDSELQSQALNEIFDLVVVNGGLSCHLPQENPNLKTNTLGSTCGFCHEPSDIANSVIQASRAVTQVVERLGVKTPVSYTKLPSLLIIGAGPAGLTAARAAYAASSGKISVTLVERRPQIGGLLNQLGVLFPHFNSAAELKQSLHDLTGIALITSTSVEAVQLSNRGVIATLKQGDTIQDCEFGAVIMATGAMPVLPKAEDKPLTGIISQMELETILNQVETGKKTLDDLKHHYVFQQCFAARDEQHPYCSGICCPTALKNALRLKELNPKIQISIIQRNIVTPGRDLELLYRQASEFGVRFLSCKADQPPKALATIDNPEQLGQVSLWDSATGQNLIIPAERLVLSTPLRPTPTTAKLGTSLGLSLEPMPSLEFLCGIEPAKPLETPTPGVFLAGSARWPVRVAEALDQGSAAGLKAVLWLQTPSQTHVAQVSADCSGCGRCIAACPHHALSLDPQTQQAVVMPARCLACGICTATCPCGAIDLPQPTDLLVGKDLFRHMKRIVKYSEDSKPVLVLACRYCAWLGAEKALQQGKLPDNVHLVPIECAGSVHLDLILRTLADGIAGIAVMGCHLGGCKHHPANVQAHEKLLLLQETLANLGLEPKRLLFDFGTAHEAEAFQKIIHTFLTQLEQLEQPNSLAHPLKPAISCSSMDPAIHNVFPHTDLKGDNPPACPLELQAQTAKLLEDPNCQGVLGLRLDPDLGLLPHLFTADDNLSELVTGRKWPLVKTLWRIWSNLEPKNPQHSLGIVARACDARAIKNLQKLNQLPENIHILRHNCALWQLNACHCPNPQWPDEAFGSPPLTMPVAIDWDVWREQFKRCLKCYGCRNACPICICPTCRLEDNDFLPVGQLPPDPLTFHLTRALHVADSCTGCGACTDACPAGIELYKLHQAIMSNLQHQHLNPQAILPQWLNSLSLREEVYGSTKSSSGNAPSCQG